MENFARCRLTSLPISLCFTSVFADLLVPMCHEVTLWFITNHHATCLLATDKPCSRAPNTRERKGMTSSTKTLFSLSLSLSLSLSVCLSLSLSLPPSFLLQRHSNKHGTFITLFTTAKHLSLPEPAESSPFYPLGISLKFSLILYSHLHLSLQNCLLASIFSTKTLYAFLLSPRVQHFLPTSIHERIKVLQRSEQVP